MRLALAIVPLVLMIGCKATVEVGNGENPTAYPSPIGPAAPEVRISDVDAELVASWATRLRAASAGIARYVDTSRGNVLAYVAELRALSAEMHRYLAGAGTMPLSEPDSAPAGPPSSNGWGQPDLRGYGVSDEAEAARQRGVEALEELGE